MFGKCGSHLVAAASRLIGVRPKSRFPQGGLSPLGCHLEDPLSALPPSSPDHLGRKTTYIPRHS